MKKVILLFHVLFLVAEAHAQMQPGTSFQSLIDVSTNSPDVASLGKFGNIPVSYATGVPSITIPIYEINVGGIKLPLSLDYHAGGIRVDETASSVGLGWALSGIGLVSRKMVGAPDDDGSYGLLTAPDQEAVFLNQGAYSEYLYNIMQGRADNEPDLFSYTINGQSGKFTFRRNGSIMQTPVTNNRIVYNNGSFIITDPNGIVYIFSQQLRNSITAPVVNNNYVASWRLTKMVAANTLDTIYFSYETTCNYTIQKNKNYTHHIGLKMACHTNGASESFVNEGTESYQTMMLYDAFPKEIRWRGGMISFTNTCDRTDVAVPMMRLTGVDVYANQEGTYKQTKHVQLYHSYFTSSGTGYAFTNATDDQKKRLRLDSVGFAAVSGGPDPQVYRMTYDNTTMAPRESAAQDRWGFNNGAFDNAILMPQQTVLYFGTYYTFGSANRQPDSTKMTACTISSIQYPTKGKTEFKFAPHAFTRLEMQSQPGSVYTYCEGGIRSTDSKQFTVTADDVNFSYSLFISAFSGAPVTNRPRITLTDQTNGTEVLGISTPPGSEGSSYSQNNVAMTLTAGHTYVLTVNIYTSSPGVTAEAEINWTHNLGYQSIRRIGGGLRVKSITNYDENGTMAGKELYEYDGGTMLTDVFYQDINYEEVLPRGGMPSGNLICIYTYPQAPGYALIYHANGVLPVSEAGGSPLLYGAVTKYQVDSEGNTNGKTEYGYKVYTDYRAAPSFAPPYGNHEFPVRGLYLSSNDWKNNFPTYENVYKSTPSGYKIVHSKVYDYWHYRDTSEYRIKVLNKFITYCCQEYHKSPDDALFDFEITPIPQYTGAMLLRSESDTTWDDNGNRVYTTRQYEYNDTTHTYPTLMRSSTSSGEVLSDLSKYPHDFAATGNVYQKMMSRNIVSPLVQQIRQKDGVQLSLTSINYTDWNNDSKLLLPQTVAEQISSYPAETRIRFNKFDVYGNIQEQQKEGDIKQSYVWGYDTLYPIATVTNAAQSDIAYTSFEPDASGYWTIPSATRDATQGITGRQSYALSNGTIAKNGLSSAKSFIVSYWSKSSSASVNASTATALVSRNGWNYYEHELPAGISSVTVSGSVIIDELRLYPVDAQMNTFTYDPLVGMTSQCSANNLITYYEFDALGRLKVIRDMDNKVLKVFEYYYKQ